MEWKPIETAPRDGSRIFVWADEWFAPATAQYYGALGWRFEYNAIPTYQPTHWMPLPLPPDAPGEKNGLTLEQRLSAAETVLRSMGAGESFGCDELANAALRASVPELFDGTLNRCSPPSPTEDGGEPRRVKTPALERPELEALLRAAAGREMSPYEANEQRRSWVRGEMGLSHPEMSSEQIAALVDKVVPPLPTPPPAPTAPEPEASP